MNKQEVLDFIKENVSDGPEEILYGLEKNKSILSYKEVDSEGGYEGGGEELYSVNEVTLKDKSKFFVQIEGYYMSYDGSNWERAFEVKGKEKTITVYEKVK